MRVVISNDINLILTMGTHKRKQNIYFDSYNTYFFIFPEHVMHSIENINLTQIPSLEEIELRDKDTAVVCSR